LDFLWLTKYITVENFTTFRENLDIITIIMF
jgi:hypothetical protein